MKSTGANDVSATSADRTFNTTELALSNVASGNLTNRGATITWTTDAPATSQVEYGTTAEYGSTTTLDTELVTSHSVTATGLLPETEYHYRVLSTTDTGDAASADQTFTTGDKVTFTIGSTTQPSTDNPFQAHIGAANGSHFSLMHEPCVWTMFDGSTLPAIAESWSYDDDTMTWTINLNPDAKFSNGEQVTADDVKFSFDKYMELDLGQTVDLKNVLIETNPITAVNDTTVTFELETFAATFIRYLGDSVIVPESIWGDMSNDDLMDYANEDPVGSGPFTLIEREVDSH